MSYQHVTDADGTRWTRGGRLRWREHLEQPVQEWAVLPWPEAADVTRPLVAWQREPQHLGELWGQRGTWPWGEPRFEPVREHWVQEDQELLHDPALGLLRVTRTDWGGRRAAPAVAMESRR